MSRDRADRAWAGAGLVLALALAGTPSALSAQSTTTARDAYLAADFPGAAREFDRVLASPSATRVDTLEAHRHLATLRFVLGDAVAAEAHARAAITLAPDARPVEGSPLEISTLFDAARAELGGRDSLVIEHTERGDGTHGVDAALTPWPSALDATLALSCSSPSRDGTWRTRARPPRVRLELPELRDDVRCRAELVPATGGDAWIDAELLLPGAGATTTREPSEDGDDDALIAGLVGGGAALVIAAVVVSVVLLVDADAQRAGFGSTVVVPGW